jgi:hypothetical protein
MATSCTIFSVTEQEVGTYLGDDTIRSDLPGYDDLSSKISRSGSNRDHMVQLGDRWSELHAAFGSKTGEHPLAFMVSGGERVIALETVPTSSGRYLDPAHTAALLAAIEDISDRELPPAVWPMVRDLQAFLTEAVDAKRGIIVHQF